MVQEYQKYTAEDHEVWSILFNKQMEIIKDIAAEDYLKGISKCEFKSDRIPNFTIVNKNLNNATGWSIYVVPGLIDNKPFFEHLRNKEFPSSTWLRNKKQLAYLEEPDMFHDVFGHVPLLSDKYFCKFLEGLSLIALDYIDNELAVELISRIYWYTVEFGLIKENDQVKIYGAGILSSSEECQYSVEEVDRHVPFDVGLILNTPYIKDRLQEQYFVIDSYEDLYDSLPRIRKLIAEWTPQRSAA